jgi:hypothetical protein
MGWWKSSHGMIGDAPADVMDRAFRQLEAVYTEQAGRLPTQGEIADLIQFSSCGTFDVRCGADAEPFSKEKAGHDPYPRARERGEQGILGAAAACGPGEMVNVDPKTGDHYEAGEAKIVLDEQRREARESYETGGD